MLKFKAREDLISLPAKKNQTKTTKDKIKSPTNEGREKV